MLVTCGLAVGALGALMLMRTLKNLISAVTSPHPVTLVLLGIVLAIVALAACVIPARYATQVDPNIALKYE
jgi:ABC-type antimicrobial peptide transport system permease subunit